MCINTSTTKRALKKMQLSSVFSYLLPICDSKIEQQDLKMSRQNCVNCSNRKDYLRVNVGANVCE